MQNHLLTDLNSFDFNDFPSTTSVQLMVMKNNYKYLIYYSSGLAFSKY